MASPGAWAAGSLEGELASVALELLKPGEVTPSLVSREIRRARRLGLYWRILSPLERALLEVASRLRVERFKSPRVREMLAALIARIELHTARGLVLVKGLSRALSTLGGRLQGLLRGGLRALVSWARGRLGYLRYLGRSMLVLEEYLAGLLGP
ncbi:hypothetical protein [Stetteria hydrogenophila]